MTNSMILASAGAGLATQIRPSWGANRPKILALLADAPVDAWGWSRFVGGAARVGEIMGISERTVRLLLRQLVAARVLEHDPGAGSRPAGYRLNAALDKWRDVPWAVAPELVDFRARKNGWIVERPDPVVVRGSRTAEEGLFVRGSRTAEEEFLSAALGPRESDSFVRGSRTADKSARSVIGALPDSELRASDSLEQQSESESESDWSPTAGEINALIGARGLGEIGRRTKYAPRLEGVARRMTIDEAARRLASAPAHFGAPLCVDWLEKSPPAPAPRVPVEPLWQVPPEPEPGAALDHEEILARLGGLKAGLARRRGVVGATMKGETREGVNQ